MGTDMKKESRSGEGGGLAKRLLTALRKNKKLEIACYGALALLITALYLAGMGTEKRSDKQVNVTDAAGKQVAADTETRLREVLSCIRGAGKVEVMITYETGAELVPAMRTKVNSTSSESSGSAELSTSIQRTEDTEVATVSGQDGDSPIVLTEREPTVRGVIVVAEGAADIRVMLDLQRAVRAVLNVPLTAVEVFEYAANDME